MPYSIMKHHTIAHVCQREVCIREEDTHTQRGEVGYIVGVSRSGLTLLIKELKAGKTET